MSSIVKARELISSLGGRIILELDRGFVVNVPDAPTATNIRARVDRSIYLAFAYTRVSDQARPDHYSISW